VETSGCKWEQAEVRASDNSPDNLYVYKNKKGTPPLQENMPKKN
jgi:hypothetical protein